MISSELVVSYSEPLSVRVVVRLGKCTGSPEYNATLGFVIQAIPSRDNVRLLLLPLVQIPQACASHIDYYQDLFTNTS